MEYQKGPKLAYTNKLIINTNNRPIKVMNLMTLTNIFIISLHCDVSVHVPIQHVMYNYRP